MASYKDLMAQIEQLKTEAEELRKSEISAGIAEIKAKMDELGITIEDLAGASRRTRKASAAVGARYRDPQSGETWSGRGRSPRWLVDAEAAGKPRSEFLIG